MSSSKLRVALKRTRMISPAGQMRADPFDESERGRLVRAILASGVRGRGVRAPTASFMAPMRDREAVSVAHESPSGHRQLL